MTISPLPAPTGGAPAKNERSSLVLARAKPAVIVVGSFALLLVVIQLVNSAMSYSLDPRFGIVPRTWDGLTGILSAPLLHGSWGHLLSNLLPLLIFGFLIMLGTARQFVAVTALVWLVSGLGVWLFGPGDSATVGASGPLGLRVGRVQRPVAGLGSGPDGADGARPPPRSERASRGSPQAGVLPQPPVPRAAPG